MSEKLLFTSNGQLFGWSQSVWQWLDQLSIMLGLALTMFSILAVAVGFFNRDRIRRWLVRPLSGSEISNDTIANYQGMIFTVSHADLPIALIEKSKLQAIGLLGTVQSNAAIEEIAAHAKKKNITVFCETQANPDNVLEACNKIEWLIACMQEREIEPVAVDITGGKLPMSIGAMRAAEKNGIDVIYVTCCYDQSLRKLDPKSARPILLITHK